MWLGPDQFCGFVYLTAVLSTGWPLPMQRACYEGARHIRLAGPRTSHFTASYLEIPSLKCSEITLKRKKRSKQRTSQNLKPAFGRISNFRTVCFQTEFLYFGDRELITPFLIIPLFHWNLPRLTHLLCLPQRQQVILGSFLLNCYMDVNSVFIKGHILSFSEGTLSSCTHGWQRCRPLITKKYGLT